MSDFSIYFQLGLNHIADFAAYDHMLFIATLCAVYFLRDWKKILILVTAFTIGHSLTLVLATFKLFSVPQNLVEVLIPVTILVTALHNFWRVKSSSSSQPNNLKSFWGSYIVVMVFGLIHGMGFSSYLQMLLGKESNIFFSLLAFNIGIEVGQLLIVVGLVVVSYILVNLLKIPQRWWVWGISGIAILVSIKMIVERM